MFRDLEVRSAILWMTPPLLPEDTHLLATERRRARQPRLLLVLVGALVILGTSIGLLLSHNAESSHAVDTVGASVVDVHVGVPTVTDAPAALFADSLALCLSIGVGCVIAFLLVFLSTRRSPSVRSHAPPRRTTRPPWLRVLRAPASPNLDALCISRV